MKTIAEEAGVTLPTVSRILNKKGGKYAEATKEKIFEIADRLKYRPNALVHGMQSGRTNTAGVMIPVIGQFYAQIIEGIHNTFVDKGIIMLLGWGENINAPKDDTKERKIIHQLVDRRVDGVILRPSCEAFELSYFEEIWERNIPLILIDREMTNITTDFVGTDDEAGGIAAAEHLIGLGHQRILFAGSSEQVSTSRQREAGFRKVIGEYPNASRESLDIDKPDHVERLMHYLKQDNGPTAIFAYSDPSAEHIADILIKAGISIPGDISIVGFGDQPSGTCPIALTTFDQHPQIIGKTAAEIYLELITEETRSDIRRERITPDIILRASTTPPQ